VLELVTHNVVQSSPAVEAVVKKMGKLAAAVTRSPRRRRALKHFCAEMNIPPKAPIKYVKVSEERRWH